MPRKQPRPYISPRVIILDPDGLGRAPLLKTCAHCGEPYAPTEPKQGFCSERCRKRSKEARRRRRQANQ